MLLIISSLCLLFFVKFGIMDWEFLPWGVKQRRTKTGNGFPGEEGRDVTGEKKKEVPGINLHAGLSACFQAMFANPSGSASDVLFANIYVNRFCLLRYFGSGCLLLFIHELWCVCAHVHACLTKYLLFIIHYLQFICCCW